MPEWREFTATIEAGARGGAYFAIPFDVEEAFGARRPKLVATFDGVPYRGVAVRMGSNDHVIVSARTFGPGSGRRSGTRSS